MNRDWSTRKERGNQWWLTFMRVLALHGGRRLARLCLIPAVAWFLLFARREQRCVRDFRRRAQHRAPRWRDVVHTYWNFGAVTLDRVFPVAGRDAVLDVRVPAPLLTLHHQPGGAILLGAHLGSFFTMRALAHCREDLDIHILFYPEHNARITRVFDALNPALARQSIALGSPDVLVQLRERIEAGGFVAALADRVSPGDTHVITHAFLGAPARFPTGIAEAALVLGCPVLFFAGLYRGGNRYDLLFERLSTGERVARRERPAATAALVGKYVACLERQARSAPDNWFNFYDYWAQ